MSDHINIGIESGGGFNDYMNKNKQTHNNTFRTFDESIIPTSETFLESTNVNSFGLTQRTNDISTVENSKINRNKIKGFVQLLKKDHQEKNSKIGNITIKGINNGGNNNGDQRVIDNNKDDVNNRNRNTKIRLSLSPGKNYIDESDKRNKIINSYKYSENIDMNYQNKIANDNSSIISRNSNDINVSKSNDSINISPLNHRSTSP